jgi:hypothetical protein
MELDENEQDAQMTTNEEGSDDEMLLLPQEWTYTEQEAHTVDECIDKPDDDVNKAPGEK